MINIAPWTPARKAKPQTVALHHVRHGWVTTPSLESKVATASSKETCAATQLDSDVEESKQDAEMGEGGAAAKRPAVDSPSKTCPETAHIKKRSTVITAPASASADGPDGVKTWNLGGSGDCGFRCLAAGGTRKPFKQYKNTLPL